MFEKSAVPSHGKLHWEKEWAKRRCGGTGSMPGDHSPSRSEEEVLLNHPSLSIDGEEHCFFF